VDVAEKKIKFHFVKTQAKNDVWLEQNSNRIAALHSHTIKPKPQSKSQVSCAVVPKDSQEKCENPSQSGASKMKKSKTIQTHETASDSTPELSRPDKDFNEFGISLNETEKQKVKINIEDEEESDGISFGDIDDEDSDDETPSPDDVGTEEVGVVTGKNKEEVEESPTVTDHSSIDGSLKRDPEVIHAEHSDLENECGKASDQSKSRFTIPKKKKKESTTKSSIVIPKKVIPKKSSQSSGASLISHAARQAMVDKKREKKSTSFTKRPFSHNHSPSKDVRQADRNKMNLDDHNSPTLKRKAFSDLRSSQSHHTRSPVTNDPQMTESPVNNVDNRRSMLSPKHSMNDRYSLEQRRERELYRDSKEYTARGECYSYQVPSDSRNHSIFSSSPKRSLNDRYSVEQRRERELYRDSKEYTARAQSYSYHDLNDSYDRSRRSVSDRQDLSQSSPSSDRRRGSDRSIGRNYDCCSQQDRYEADRCGSDYYARSHNQDYRERHRERSSDCTSRSFVRNGDAEYDQSNEEGLRPDRRTNLSDTYSNDYRRFDHYNDRDEEESSAYTSRSYENDLSRRTRGFNERDIDRDSHLRRVDNEYLQPCPTHPDDDEFRRDSDRHSPRRRRDSERRREKRRRRKFDGSDEYSRRLGSNNHPPGHDYVNQDVGRDRYHR
jgi:hypothetical protein